MALSINLLTQEIYNIPDPLDVSKAFDKFLLNNKGKKVIAFWIYK